MTTQQDYAFLSEQLRHVPMQKPLVVKESATVKKTIKDMQKNRIGCALIMNKEGTLTGIFTERDVMKKFVATPLAENTKIAEVMTKNPKIMPPDTTVSEVIDFFGKTGIRHLPICETLQKVSGLLSVRYLMDFISEHLPGTVLNLPPDAGIVSKETDGG